MHHAAHRVGAAATLAVPLRAGGQGLLLPESASEREAIRLKKVRHCARRLIVAYAMGGCPVSRIDGCSGSVVGPFGETRARRTFPVPTSPYSGSCCTWRPWWTAAPRSPVSVAADAPVSHRCRATDAQRREVGRCGAADCSR